MTEYTNFTKDFVNRTQDILNNYYGKYEVTNLINCCLGLIIIPKQNIGIKFPNYTFDNSNKRFGISKKNIIFEESYNFSLSNILRHIRNGIAHGRIDQKTIKNKIVGLRIHDKQNSDSNENFAIQFTIEELKFLL